MAFNLHIPLPGPISYNHRIGGGSHRTRRATSSGLAALFVVPLVLSVKLVWWTLLGMYWLCAVCVYAPIKAAITSTHLERTESGRNES